MVKWFKSDNDEIDRLDKAIAAVKTELKERDLLIDMYKKREVSLQNWIDSMKEEVMRANIRCEMYDKIMRGLHINVNLGKKEK
jgi:thymidylate synthase